MIIIILLLLSILCGVLGRLGGRAKDGIWYDFLSNTKARDIGCSLMVLSSLLIVFGFHLNLWWVYLLLILLHLGAFSTYYDTIFGYDNLWFSGFMVGLALLPFAWFGIAWWLILIRAILLAIIWGCLNKYLPDKVLIWRRDVAEEFLRYLSVITTLLIVVIGG
jgi:hypothetical protein